MQYRKMPPSDWLLLIILSKWLYQQCLSQVYIIKTKPFCLFMHTWIMNYMQVYKIYTFYSFVISSRKYKCATTCMIQKLNGEKWTNLAKFECIPSSYHLVIACYIGNIQVFKDNYNTSNGY